MTSISSLRTRKTFLVSASGLASGAVFGYTFQISSIPAAAWLTLTVVSGTIILLAAWLAASAFLASRSSLPPERVRSEAAWPFAAFALLPIEFIPFGVIQTTGEESVLRPLSPSWQLAIVFTLSAGLVLALLINKFQIMQRGPLTAIGRHPVAALVVIMILWLIAASSMDILKTHYMNKIGGYNTAIFTDMARHTFSADGILYTSMVLADGASILGLHSSFIWILIYPLFAIWPSYPSLLILSNAALALAAIPIYLLSRKFFSAGLSLLIVAIFLFNRLIIAQPGIGDLSEERFLPVLILTAFYFWYTRKFYLFLAFAFLCLMVREDMGIVLVLWGILGLVQRRSYKWVLTPAILGGAWLVVMAKWVLPFFNPTGQPVARAVERYEHLGNSTGEIFSNLIKPWVLLRIPFSSIRHLSAWYVLFQSFGYGAPLLAGPVLLALVYIAEVMFLDRPGLNLFNMIPLAAALMPAMILGLARADRYARALWNFRVSTIIVLLSLFSTTALSYSWFNPNLYKPRYNYDTASYVLEQMPEGSTAILPDFMASLAKPSQTVRGYHQMPYELERSDQIDLREDYVVIDMNVPARFIATNVYDGLTKLKETVESSDDYRLILDKDDLQVYQRHS